MEFVLWFIYVLDEDFSLEPQPHQTRRANLLSIKLLVAVVFVFVSISLAQLFFEFIAYVFFKIEIYIQNQGRSRFGLLGQCYW